MNDEFKVLLEITFPEKYNIIEKLGQGSFGTVLGVYKTICSENIQSRDV